jgi:hypothetical protein
MNSDAALDEVILNPDLRHINFFNGRLLTGGDLKDEQNAQYNHLLHLGGAVGDGVAFGLEVAAANDSPPGDQVVIVAAGLAVNRAGQALRLACDQRVALIRPPDPANRDACVFADCETAFTSGCIARGAGFYLLTVAPASQPEGKAPVSGLGNAAASCNSRYNTAGVKFRLLPLDVDAGSVAAQARNTVAYQFFDLTTKQATSFLANPQPNSIDARSSWDELVSRHQLTEFDVPLAVVEWQTTGSIGFLDMWSVRRQINHQPASLWPLALEDQSRCEGEARYFQFQDQIEAMRTSGTDLSTVEARQVFRYLPPVGILPLTSPGYPGGFDRARFFQGITVRDPLYIEGAKVRHLMQLALDFPPIDLQSAQMVWLYLIRENVQANPNAGASDPQPVLLFASGQLPYMAVPQFDVSRWTYSNYLLA